MNAQYQHEPKVIIDEYFRVAVRAEQIRMAKSNKPRPIAALLASIRTSITTMVAAVGGRVHQAPAVCQDPVETPTTTAVVTGASQ